MRLRLAPDEIKMVRCSSFYCDSLSEIIGDGTEKQACCNICGSEDVSLEEVSSSEKTQDHMDLDATDPCEDELMKEIDLLTSENARLKSELNNTPKTKTVYKDATPLRDQFAMAALQGLLTNGFDDSAAPGRAYRMADGMLEARDA